MYVYVLLCNYISCLRIHIFTHTRQTSVYIHIHTHINTLYKYTHTYIHVYSLVFMCVHVYNAVSVCEFDFERVQQEVVY